MAEIVYRVANTKLIGGIDNARIGCVARIAELTLKAVTERWIRQAREVDPPNNLGQDPVEVWLVAVREYLAIRQLEVNTFSLLFGEVDTRRNQSRRRECSIRIPRESRRTVSMVPVIAPSPVTWIVS